MSTAHIRMIFNVCPGIFESDDGGHSWRQISDLSAPLTSIVLDGSDSSRMYGSSAIFGSGGAFTSGDGGHGWRSLDPPVPLGALVLSASGGMLYAGSEQGLYRLPISRPRLIPAR